MYDKRWLIVIAVLLSGSIPVRVSGQGSTDSQDGTRYENTLSKRVTDSAELARLRKAAAQALGPKLRSEQFTDSTLIDWVDLGANAHLARALPGARFYSVWSNSSRRVFARCDGFLIGARGRVYILEDFNTLLADLGTPLDDTNAVAAAQAFAMLAAGRRGFARAFARGGRGIHVGFPTITVLSAGKQGVLADSAEHIRLEVKYYGMPFDWDFLRRSEAPGRFSDILVDGNSFLSLTPAPVPAKVAPAPVMRTGPEITVDSLFGSTRVRHDGDSLSYEIPAIRHGRPTDDSLRFLLLRFPKDSHNVYVRVVSGWMLKPTRLFQRVPIDAAGRGTLIWQPHTDIGGEAVLTAGFADTSMADPESSYQPVTPECRLWLKIMSIPRPPRDR